MGCAQSKIENEEAVARCKERKQLMKEAVSARNAFAAAHSAYAMALKNTGAALSDYSHGEFLLSGHSTSSSAATEIASSSSLPTTAPPPPPLPSSSSSSSAAAAISNPAAVSDTLPPPPPPPPLPLQRAATMPEMNGRSGDPSGIRLNGAIIEEDGTDDDEEDSETDNRNRLVRKSVRNIINDPPPIPPVNSKPIPPPRQHHNQPQHQQPQQQQTEPFFDYLFPNVDNMPGTTLEYTPLPQPLPQPQAKPQPTSPATEEEDEDEEEEEEEVETVVERKQPVDETKKVDVKKGKGIVGERRGVTATNLWNVFNEIDNDFLKASESAHEVSKMLEATRLHYHSNFADNRGYTYTNRFLLYD